MRLLHHAPALALLTFSSFALADVDPLPGMLDQNARVVAPGGTEVAAPVRGFGGRAEFAVTLAQGSCYVVATVGDETVRNMGLHLRAPGGKHVAGERKRGRAGVLRHCATRTGPHRVQIATDGKGAFLTGVYQLPASAYPPPPVVLAPTPPLVRPPPRAAYPPPPLTPAPPPPVYVAPRPVVEVYVPAPYPVVVGTMSAPQRYCRFSNDCGPSEFCKENGDGQRVCMGNGGHGDECRSSIDCHGHGFCKPDSHGRRVCMDQGGPGAPCSSSIDCAGGMFCKDRGDDYHVCM